MSIRLMTMVWDIELPTTAQKLILLRLADYAADSGGSVWPARETLAKACGCDESTIKRTLKAFRECGLLHLVREGGAGPKDTNEWLLNVELLIALSSGNLKLVGGSKVLEIEGHTEPVDNDENKGGTMPPILSTRGSFEHLRGSFGPSKGVTSAPQSTTKNHHIETPLRASAREGPNYDLKSEAGSVPAHTIRRGDASWSNWLEVLSETDRQHAEASGEIVATAKWASNGRLLHVPRSGLTDQSKRIAGDAR